MAPERAWYTPSDIVLTTLKILVLIAGNNEPSNAAMLAHSFMTGAKEKGARVQTIRIADLDIEHFSLKFYEPKTNQGKDFAMLEKAVKDSDGLVIATPIWNFSVPGHLKNLIDRIGSFGLDKQSRSIGTLGGKPAYLIYTGGTPMAAWTGLQRRTVSHMSVSLRYFGCVVIGKHYEERCTPGRGKFGLVVDKRPSSLDIVKAKGKKFAKVVEYKVRTGKLPLFQALMLFAFQTGQKIKKKLGL
jgi:multimeric flavodoxin WrbA